MKSGNDLRIRQRASLDFMYAVDEWRSELGSAWSRLVTAESSSTRDDHIAMARERWQAAFAEVRRQRPRYPDGDPDPACAEREARLFAGCEEQLRRLTRLCEIIASEQEIAVATGDGAESASSAADLSAVHQLASGQNLSAAEWRWRQQFLIDRGVLPDVPLATCRRSDDRFDDLQEDLPVAKANIMGFLVYSAVVGAPRGQTVRLVVELLAGAVPPVEDAPSHFCHPRHHWLLLLDDDSVAADVEGAAGSGYFGAQQAFGRALAAVEHEFGIAVPVGHSLRWRIETLDASPVPLYIEGGSLGLAWSIAIARVLGMYHGRDDLRDLPLSGLGATGVVRADGQVLPIGFLSEKQQGALTTAIWNPQLLHAMLVPGDQTDHSPDIAKPVLQRRVSQLSSVPGILASCKLDAWCAVGELYGDSVDDPYADTVVGREPLYDRFDDLLHQGHNALLYGSWGVGKSAALAGYQRQRPANILLRHRCSADDPQSSRPETFVLHLIGALCRADPAHYAQELTSLEDSPLASRTAVHTAIKSNSGAALRRYVLTKTLQLFEPCWIIVDALDEAPDGHLSDLLAELAAALSSRPGLSQLRLLVSCREEDLEHAVRGIRRQAECEIALAADDQRVALMELARFRLTRGVLAIALAAGGVHVHPACESLVAKAAGRFQWLVFALNGLQLDARHRGIVTMVDVDGVSADINQLYRRYFKRIFDVQSRLKGSLTGQEALELVAYLAAAREPLSSGGLAALAEVNVELLDAFCHDMRYFLYRDAHGYLRPKHATVSDWFVDMAKPPWAVIAEPAVRARYLDLCTSAWRDPSHPLHTYARHQMPAHLGAARRWDELYDLLISFDYWKTRAFAHELFELTRTLDSASRQLWLVDTHAAEVLRLLREALGRDIHFLHRQPDALLSSVWRHAWWYDHPDSARHYYHRNGPWNDRATLPKRFQLHAVMEAWSTRQRAPWLRASRPPATPLNSSLKQILGGHENSVTCVAVGGNHYASGSYDKNVRIWDAVSGECLQTLTGHDEAVTSVAISGNRIVSGSVDKTVRVWDLVSGALLFTLTGHDRCVRGVAISGDCIVSGADDRAVCVWDAVSGTLLCTLTGHDKRITSVAVSGDHIVSGSIDKTVRIWDVASGRCLRILVGHFDWILSVAVSGERIVSGSDDNTVRIWDLASGDCLQTLEGHADWVTSVAISGDHIVSGSRDKTVRVWHAVSGECLYMLSGLRRIVNGVAISGDNIVIGSDEMTVHVKDTARDEWQQVPEGHSNRVTSVAAGNDLFVSGSVDNTVRVWSSVSGECLQMLPADHKAVVSVATFGEHIACGAGASVLVWDALSGDRLHTLWIDYEIANIVAISREHIACGFLKGILRLWDLKSGRRLHTLKGHRGDITSISIFGDRIVSGANDKDVRVWDTVSGECIHILTGHIAKVRSIAISGDRIISRDVVGNVIEWDLFAGSRLREGTFQEAADRLWRADDSGAGLSILDPCGRIVARWPEPIRDLCSLDGRTWGGAVGHHVVIVSLEMGDRQAEDS